MEETTNCNVVVGETEKKKSQKDDRRRAGTAQINCFSAEGIGANQGPSKELGH